MSEYQRGFRHGKLNVYNPGVLHGDAFQEYMTGWQAGREFMSTWIKFLNIGS